ncbi:hypothetical protein Tco_1385407 [Tanacetum coccineum]
MGKSSTTNARSHGKTVPKAKEEKGATWFRDKVLMGIEHWIWLRFLNEEELEFLADLGVAEAKAFLMANLSRYRSDVLSEEKEAKNIDKEIALEKKVKELDNIKAQHIRPMLYDGGCLFLRETNVISLLFLKAGLLMLEEESQSKMLLKQNIVNIVVNSSVDMNTSMNVNSPVAMNDSVNYVEM